jgi:hypothetical protein
MMPKAEDHIEGRIIDIEFTKIMLDRLNQFIKFFKNIWNFREVLSEYEPWDYRFQLSMFRRALELESQYIDKKGNEVNPSRSKKVNKMNRAIEIMKWHESECFVDLAQSILGKDAEYNIKFETIKFNGLNDEGEDVYKIVEDITEEQSKINKEIYDLADKIEKDTWVELFQILKGGEYKIEHGDWDEWFDGSGLKGWWD